MVDEPHLGSGVPDLQSLLMEMVVSVLGEEPEPAPPALTPSSPTAVSRLIVHDVTDDSYVGVEIRAAAELVSVLASGLLGVSDPAPDDQLDVIAELGNIAAGNIKTMLCGDGRLSLPSAAIVTSQDEDPAGSVRGSTLVLGHVMELVVMPLTGAADTLSQVRWPGGPAVSDPHFGHLVGR
jgi:hypothetical protein